MRYGEIMNRKINMRGSGGIAEVANESVGGRNVSSSEPDSESSPNSKNGRSSSDSESRTRMSPLGEEGDVGEWNSCESVGDDVADSVRRAARGVEEPPSSDMVAARRGVSVAARVRRAGDGTKKRA